MNTVKGIMLFAAGCSFLLLPLLQLCSEGRLHGADTVSFLLAFVGMVLLWFLMLLPALMMRLIIGGRGNAFFGLAAAILSLSVLAALYVIMGEKAHGSLMLVIYLFGAYKLVVSHFGLRSLGIPLSLPEWRTPAPGLEAPPAGQGKEADAAIEAPETSTSPLPHEERTDAPSAVAEKPADSPSPSLRAALPESPQTLLQAESPMPPQRPARQGAVTALVFGFHLLCWLTMFGVLFICAFSAGNLGRAAGAAVLMQLCSFPPATFSLTVIGKTLAAYRGDMPGKALAYGAIGTLAGGLWFGIQSAIIGLCIPDLWAQEEMNRGAFRHPTVFVLAAVGIMVFLALHALVRHIRRAARENRLRAWHYGVPLTLLLVLFPVGTMSFPVYCVGIFDKETPYYIELPWQTTRDAGRTDVHLLPSYLIEPTKHQQDVARKLAAFYLEDKDRTHTLHSNVSSPSDEKALTDRYLNAVFYGASSYTVCLTLLQEFPENQQQEKLKELECILQEQLTTGQDTAMRRFLSTLLRDLATERSEYPNNSPLTISAYPSDLTPKERLMRAIAEGCPGEVRMALRDGADASSKTFPAKDLPQDLFYSCCEKTVSDDFRNGYSMSPLQFSIALGHTPCTMEILREDPAFCQEKANFPQLWEALHECRDPAAFHSELALLLDLGMNPNATISVFFTTEEWKALLRQNLAQSMPTLTAEERKEALSDERLRRLSESVPHSYELTLLHAVAQRGNADDMRLLLQHGAIIRNLPFVGSPLHIAASAQDEKKVQLLLKEHADINAATEKGFTPLLRVVKEGKTDMAEYLMSQGADIFHETTFGNSALWFAVLNNNTRLIERLTEKGLRPRATVDAAAPKELRCAIIHQQINCIPLLIRAGAPLDTEDDAGISDGMLLLLLSEKEPELRSLLTLEQRRIYAEKLFERRRRE